MIGVLGGSLRSIECHSNLLATTDFRLNDELYSRIGRGSVVKLVWLVDWCSTALSAQTGYIVP